MLYILLADSEEYDTDSEEDRITEMYNTTDYDSEDDPAYVPPKGWEKSMY